MRLLLDTHALLWWLAGDERLALLPRAEIDSAANQIFVSAVSAWEIATKVRIGKLPHAADVAHRFSEIAASQNFRELAITVAHGQRAGLMEGAHRDPFDRMLIAQALVEDLVLVSNEVTFDAFGVKRLW